MCASRRLQALHFAKENCRREVLTVIPFPARRLCALDPLCIKPLCLPQDSRFEPAVYTNAHEACALFGDARLVSPLSAGPYISAGNELWNILIHIRPSKIYGIIHIGPSLRGCSACDRLHPEEPVQRVDHGDVASTDPKRQVKHVIFREEVFELSLV